MNTADTNSLGDFTDAIGTPIVPGTRVAVACVGGYSSKRAELRIGTVYRVSLRSIGVMVENASRWGSGGPAARSYRKPKNFIVIK